MLLGQDPATWSKFEPLPAAPALLESFPHFASAVRAAADGDVEGARLELQAMDSAAIREWYIEHAQIAGNCRVKALGCAPQPKFGGEIDPLVYPNASVVQDVLARDGYRCRYCQRPVVHEKLLKAVRAVVGAESLPFGPTNLTAHGAVFAHRAVLDHVLPRKRGGRTEPGNLVTACYPCNFGKAEYTLEQLGLCPPRPAVVDTWDGLHSLLPTLKEQACRV